MAVWPWRPDLKDCPWRPVGRRTCPAALLRAGLLRPRSRPWSFLIGRPGAWGAGRRLPDRAVARVPPTLAHFSSTEGREPAGDRGGARGRCHRPVTAVSQFRFAGRLHGGALTPLRDTDTFMTLPTAAQTEIRRDPARRDGGVLAEVSGTSGVAPVPGPGRGAGGATP